MQYILNKIKEKFPDIGQKIELEIPPDIKMGDFALPCFAFAKVLKKSPIDIAQDIAKQIKSDDIIAKTKALGPYVNFFLQPKYLFETTCQEILKRKNRYGESDFGQNQKILVEYSGPNTNKPLHLGHARNNVLGMALINILEASGYKVIKANIINDRGVHINKSTLAYQKWGYGKTPQSEHKKGDHFVGEYYVLYDQMKKESPELEDEIREMLKKWEAGDRATIKLWKKLRKWAIDGMNETYKRMGCKFDVVYYESDTYKEGKEFVRQGLKNKIFQREKDKTITIDLTKQGLDKKVVLRSDGTAVYVTQDIATSKRKFDQFSPDRAIWVVASEQEYHFNVLFEILAKLKIAKREQLYHLSYGMVNLSSGKMKSREGNVVDIDNLLDELHGLAGREIAKRDEKISKKNLAKRAEIISLGALKYYLVKAQPKREITFNPAESISFDGNTGPYVQYAYARIQSILNKKTRKHKNTKTNFSLLGNLEERNLINLLTRFPQVIQEAAGAYNPSKVANFIYDLAKSFNNFYHQHSVLSATLSVAGSDAERLADNAELVQARLKLVECVGVVLKNGLSLLGVEVVEVM